jgi:hypothetical protein
MPEWLRNSFHNGGQLPVEDLVYQIGGRLAAACVLGCIVAAIYASTHRKEKGEGAGFITTLVLLTILIAMVTLIIGDNVARAFSLVGALAIVRFRTVVADTRDTAFVIFAVVVGMAAGAGYLLVPLIGIPIVGIAAFVFRTSTGSTRQGCNGTLTVRVDIGRDPHALVHDALEKHLSKYRLVATGTARQGTALELKYTASLRDVGESIGLISDLKQTEGIQSAEFRQR